MKLNEFLQFRKDKNNYKYASDYADDNKIKALAYYGKNGRLYIKNLKSHLTRHQKNIELVRCDNGIVWGK